MKIIDKIERLDDTIDDFCYFIEQEKDIELKDILMDATAVLVDYKLDLTLNNPDVIEKRVKEESKPINRKEIENLMIKAVFDDVIYCIECGHQPLEPDYDVCISCKCKNPLKELGLI